MALLVIGFIAGSGASFSGATWNGSYIGNSSGKIILNDGSQHFMTGNVTSKVLCGVSISDDKFRCHNVNDPLNPISLYNYTRSSGTGSIDGAYAVEKIGNLVGIIGSVDGNLALFRMNDNFSLTFIANYTSLAGACSLDSAYWFKFDNRSGNIYTISGGRNDDVLGIINWTPAILGSGVPICINWSNRSSNPCTIDNTYSGDYDPVRQIIYFDSNTDDTISKMNLSGNNILAPICLKNFTSSAPPSSADGVMKIRLIPESNYTVLIATGRDDDNIWLANVTNSGISFITGTNFTDGTPPCSINNIRGLEVSDGGRTIKTGIGSGTGATDSYGGITVLNISDWNKMSCIGWINATTDVGYYMNYTYWFTIDNRTNNTYTYVTGVLTDVISIINETNLYPSPVEVPPANGTCSCPVGVNWVVNLPDHCNVTGDCDISGYILRLENGTVGDYFNVSAMISCDYLDLSVAGSGAMLTGTSTGYIKYGAIV